MIISIKLVLCVLAHVLLGFSLPTDKEEIVSKRLSNEYYHPSITRQLPSELKDGPIDNWEELGQQEIQKALNAQKIEHKAKNVILFIGDGMGMSTITASRWLLQQMNNGTTMQDTKFSFENFDHVGVSKTYSTNRQTPDSASTATAMMTGSKCNDGVIGLRQTVARDDCEGSANPDNYLTSLYKKAQDQGMATGIVSTARVTHATPAAAYANIANRDWEYETECEDNISDIAWQLIENEENRRMQVILGGGRRAFYPNDVQDEEYPNLNGNRPDGENLVENWLNYMAEDSLEAAYVWNKEDFDAVDPENVDHLLGLFEPSHMNYEAERQLQENEPSLTEMTQKAIQILQKNNEGFVLQVESGRIDHAHHQNNAGFALMETLEFNNAIQAALDLTDPEETLIIVTADHSHVFTIAGYPSYDTDILGVDGEALDSKFYTSLGYANGPGFFFHRYNDSTLLDLPLQPSEFQPELETPRKELASNENANVVDRFYLRDAAIPLDSETHAGEDVLIYAQGPWAHLFHSVHEQSYIAAVIQHAACIGIEDERCQESSQSRAAVSVCSLILLCLPMIVLLHLFK